MKDYELTLTVKNGRLLSEMRKAGYETAADLSRATGVSQGEIGAMLNLKVPAYKDGGREPRLPVKKIADHLGLLPEDIFPESHLLTPATKNKFSAYVETAQAERLLSGDMFEPDRMLEAMETESRDVIADIIGSTKLSPRERDVLYLTFSEEKTLDQIGEEWGVCGARVRQIREKALRKMRHPMNRESIESASGVYWGDR